jgi:anti-sigma regulatory factor (Ser/Thr protein kinase)
MGDPLSTLSIRADRSEVRTASQWLGESAHQYEVPANKLLALDQCLDEVLMNIVMHGGASASETPVELSFAINQIDQHKEAAVTVSDSGALFNSADTEPKAKPSTLEEAEPGGLGLAIIQGLSDRLAYEFKGGRNILTFAIRL